MFRSVRLPIVLVFKRRRIFTIISGSSSLWSTSDEYFTLLHFGSSLIKNFHNAMAFNFMFRQARILLVQRNYQTYLKAQHTHVHMIVQKPAPHSSVTLQLANIHDSQLYLI
jgi:hypothetical protein